MWRHAGAALALLLATGCAVVGGRSRSFDAAELGTEPGWITAAPTPLVRQSGPEDCGAAALAMVAGRWHVALAGHRPLPAPPAAARAATLGELRAEARASGLEAFAIAGDRATLLHELGAGRPVIVGLVIPLGGRRARSHFEVIVAAQPGRDRFVTLDPATGFRVRTWPELDAEWLPAGRPALVVVGVTAADVGQRPPGA